MIVIRVSNCCNFKRRVSRTSVHCLTVDESVELKPRREVAVGLVEGLVRSFLPRRWEAGGRRVKDARSRNSDGITGYSVAVGIR